MRPRSLDVAYLRGSGVASDPAIMTLSRLRDADTGSKKLQLKRKSNDGVSSVNVHGDWKSALYGHNRVQEMVRKGHQDDMQGLLGKLDRVEIQDDAFDDDDMIGRIPRYTLRFLAMPFPKVNDRSRNRRRSISSMAEWIHLPRQQLQNLRIDVELCSQLLVLRDRQIDMRNASQLLKVCFYPSSRT